MALDLTEKQIDILVNGNQQASYDQRANSADYDISVSDNQNIETTVVHSFAGHDRDQTRASISSSFTISNDGISGCHTLNVSYKGRGLEESNTYVEINNTQYDDGTHSINASDGDTVDITGEAYVNDDYINYIFMNVTLEADYNAATGISVNGVTQS